MERERTIAQLTTDRDNAKKIKEDFNRKVTEEEQVHERLKEKVRELESRTNHDSIKRKKKLPTTSFQ